MTLDTSCGRCSVHGAPCCTIRSVNTVLRIILLLWVVGYLFVSCAPILNGHLLLGAITFVGAIVLFVPWVLGIVVLAALIRMTNPPRG
jgi:hypothetical protein